jgi:uncharacterized protein
MTASSGAGVRHLYIEIERLKPEPLHVRHCYDVGESLFEREDAAQVAPIEVDFTLTHKERDLHVKGRVQTTVRYQCSRCLAEVVRPLDVRFDLTYLPQAQWKPEEEIELKYEDMNIGYYDDLMVLEQIELAVPMKFLCREGCKGLCPVCGADLNVKPCSCSPESVDARFDVLRDLRSKMKE